MPGHHTSAFLRLVQARAADDVGWTVEGTHPLTGRYRGKAEFTRATFGRLGRLMKGSVRLQLEHLYVDGDTASPNCGPPRQPLLLGCRFDGDTIVEVRAYLDSAMVAYTAGDIP